MTVGEFVTVSEIRQKVEDYLAQQRMKEKGCDLDENWIEPFLTNVTNKQCIDLIIDEKFVNTVGLEKQGQEIVAYEREPLSIFNLEKDDDASDFHICEIRMVQTRKSYMLFSA